jgi:hypothetical protein
MRCVSSGSVLGESLEEMSQPYHGDIHETMLLAQRQAGVSLVALL